MRTSRSIPSRSPALRPTFMLLSGLSKLFKIRVVGLLLFAAATGAFLGSGHWPGARALLLLSLTGGLVAAGSSAINEYVEYDSDSRMPRTRDRPLVTGEIGRSDWIPLVGALLIVVPTALVLAVNPALALWVAMGSIVYLGVYTMWLKPRTPLNVVLGGAAGSCAVLSGGAVVGAWTDPGVIGLALLLFLWSPTHFWSLALACRDDYALVRIPMLPVVVSRRRAAVWSLAHAVGSAAVGLALAARPVLGLFYLVPVMIATLYLLVRAVRLVRVPSQGRAWQLFHAANLYLGLVLLAICLAVLLH